MIGTPVKVFIRTIPKSAGWTLPNGLTGVGEQFFELTNIPWKDQQALREELDALGFYVQEIHFSDPMPIQVGMEIRKRYEAEEAAKK
jgi:hypothetical protein